MLYRVHRIKTAPLEHFRWAPHTGGTAIIRAKDYDPGVEIEASSPYDAWKRLAEESESLRPGDLLEALHAGPGPTLQIAKYIGFEPAQWYVPEQKPENMVSVEGPSGEANPVAISGNIA